MADEPNAGTATEGNGSATASVSPPPADGEAGAQSEDRIAALEKQLAEINERYENEHRLRLSHMDKVEQANRIIQQGGLPPTPDPLDQEIAELQAAVAEFRAKGLTDPATNRALREAMRERESRQREVQWKNASAAAQADIAAPKESDTVKSRAVQLFNTGQYFTGLAALQAALGEETERLRAEVAKLGKNMEQREKEVLERQASAPGSPRGGGTTASGIQRVKVSEYAAKLASLQRENQEAANQYVRDKDAGKFVVVADSAF